MTGSQCLQKESSEAELLTSDKLLQAGSVVAIGSAPQFIQLPSPVYVASWISTTHVLIAAGGGGRRFGMANVLVLLSVYLSDNDHSEDYVEHSPMSSAASVRLSKEQHQIVLAAATPSATSNSISNGTANIRVPFLWRFVTALDLRDDVPWCASKYLPLEELSNTANELASKIPSISTRKWKPKTSKCLQHAHGFIALSSIRTFSLIAVEHIPQSSQTCLPMSTNDASLFARYRLLLLARVPLPSQTNNEDKKPIALVRYALVVAHDECGIHAYDLRSLLPRLEQGKSKSNVLIPVEEAIPLAKWTLPARVNDLHAERFSWVSVRLPSGKQPSQRSDVDNVLAEVPTKVRVSDYVLVAALVQDKTLRLGTFSQYGLHTFHQSCRVQGAEMSDNIEWEEETAQSESDLNENLSIREHSILGAKECGLEFNLLPSSMRLVRLFALENLSSSGEEACLSKLAMRAIEDGVESTAPLPLASLLMVVYDQHSNQSFFLHGYIIISKGPTVQSETQNVTVERDHVHNSSLYNHQEGHRRIHCRVRMGVSRPTALIKDAITCLSPCQNTSADVKDALGTPHVGLRHAVGASLPTHWVAGTVEGWILLVVQKFQNNSQEVDLKNPTCSDSSKPYDPTKCARESRMSAIESGNLSNSFFVLHDARPSFLLSRSGRPGKLTKMGCRKHSRWRHAEIALHSDPITAIAVSVRNDVVSTDIAQNVVLSTLPMPNQSKSTTIASNQEGPLKFLRKAKGLELFPKPPGFMRRLLGIITAASLLLHISCVLLILALLGGMGFLVSQ